MSNVEIDKEINIGTWLSGRAKKCCLTQILGVIHSSIRKQQKRWYVVNRLRAEQKKIPRRLRKAVNHHTPVKPNISSLNPEINSACMKYKESKTKHFKNWIEVYSYTITTKGKKFFIPIVHHRHSKKLSEKGNVIGSFLLSENTIDLRWEIQKKENKGTATLGADQGEQVLVYLSDSQRTPEQNKHGYSFNKITDIMSRKVKGSDAFRRCQAHRKNFVNWSINQLKFCHIKRIKLEDIKYIKYKSSGSRKRSHWTYPLINNKLESRCEEEDVLLSYDGACYMSQRCSCCGLVKESNRRGREFFCPSCGYEGHSDLNSSYNHQQEIPPVPWEFVKLKLSKKGFFWMKDGFYTLAGKEIAVPPFSEIGK